jgi:preprotein translocase subunit SecG
METVIIVIHLMVIVALVAVVLMQRSEGGALGIGGGGNFLSTRSQANVLTRATAILAIGFFATSLALTLLARFQERPSSILDTVPAAGTSAPAAPGGTTSGGTGTGGAGTGGTGSGGTTAPASGGILDQLKGLGKIPGTPDAGAGAGAAPTVPTTPGAAGAPAAPVTTAPTPTPDAGGVPTSQ